jgi:uncharacterized membrane protein YkoI
MTMKHTIGMTLGAVALGVVLLSTGYAASHQESKQPAYTSSIQVKDQGREGQGERHGERREAAQLARLAKLDLAQATAAALAQVPGTVLKAELDDENGNLVYSVEIMTNTHEIKDVKVDAGNGNVLHVDADDHDEEDEDDEHVQ